MDVVEASYRELFLSVVDGYYNIPMLEDDKDNKVLREHALGLLDWVEANVEFSLNSQRYFGAKAGSKEMRAKELIGLLPERPEA